MRFSLVVRESRGVFVFQYQRRGIFVEPKPRFAQAPSGAASEYVAPTELNFLGHEYYKDFAPTALRIVAVDFREFNSISTKNDWNLRFRNPYPGFQMNKCPYCGKEYPDDILNCTIDDYLLVSDAIPATETTEEAATVIKEPQVYLKFPEYQWTAKDALKCIGIIILLSILLEVGLLLAMTYIPAFRHWSGSGYRYFSSALLANSIAVVAAAYFARTESFKLFWKAFGLDRKPSEYVWWGILGALSVRFLWYFMLMHGWGHGGSNYYRFHFNNTVGPERYFYLGPLVLIAPLFEEALYRGYLYKAFRGSFSIPISIGFLLAWNAIPHWAQYTHSWLAVFDLSLLTILLCYLREKSDSLWDCIICHLTFNASLLFIGGTVR